MFLFVFLAYHTLLFSTLPCQVPSHLFENYARTPSVISMWAKHHVTGAGIADLIGEIDVCIEEQHGSLLLPYTTAVCQSNHLISFISPLFLTRS
jgi:hypothetical protein